MEVLSICFPLLVYLGNILWLILLVPGGFFGENWEESERSQRERLILFRMDNICAKTALGCISEINIHLLKAFRENLVISFHHFHSLCCDATWAWIHCLFVSLDAGWVIGFICHSWGILNTLNVGGHYSDSRFLTIQVFYLRQDWDIDM